ncbi:MAG: hypothetical protein ABIV42_07135 [Nitrosospira sp.]
MSFLAILRDLAVVDLQHTQILVSDGLASASSFDANLVTASALES